MSFDFFNEGIKPESPIIFTKEENMFLQSKLPLLDPKKSGSIALGTALQFLKFSGLRSEIYQKILKNCKIQAGTKLLTHEEMKKIFRGIALAQNNIEPSTMNIGANIKTKLPAFYDDESEEEEEPPQKQQNKPEKSNKTPEKIPEKPQQQKPQQLPLQQPAHQAIRPSTFVPASKNNKQNQSHQPPLPPQPQGDPASNKFKDFQAYWSKLPTNNNKIDGVQVKSLCKNLAQRSNLSKAWKICCLTHSGSLTKGEFFVFLQMVGSSKSPEGLTPELKQIIAQIDKGAQVKPKQKEVVPAKDFSQFGATQLFQNFGKSDPIIPAQDSKHASTVIRASSLFPSIQQTSNKIQKSLQKGQKSLIGAQQSIDNETNQLHRSQQILNNMMGEIDQFLTQVNSKNEETRAQIDELRNNQNMLNDRLNKVCVTMNGIIIKQNSFIDELMQEVHTQNVLNQQRVAVLQNYVVETNAQLQAKQRQILAIRKTAKQPQMQFKPKMQVFQEKAQSEHEEERQQEHEQEQEEKNVDQNHHQEEKPEEEAVHISQPHPQQSNAHVVQQPNAPSIQGDNVSPHVHRESISSTQSGQLQQEQADYIARMKLKQMKVIALINYITPISAVQYPQIAQRITSYSEENLDVAFNIFKQKAEDKQRADQLQMQRQQQLQRSSINSQNLQAEPDDFNTHHFRKEEEREPHQQDFFK